ncbi:hypothetical protein FOC4_g10001511 [Fusarium odoratissimum]|uniref:Uncharacterized protein n=3 Tax=Fusarium oxysporum species complex TaxID=171631 RepID=N1S3V4_FUSC4|nr:hypothetical protein FOC4_g10001511 [Fusarium odoratissimum]ENH75953.1 hypothetical protein FOC1_g10001376 [Fusarium oxysporum f. sp. cubense race 1]TXB98052.1 hypothetical protein FocTR4_00017160 [Fusarium oxysporum f. sp. cubense]
MVLITSQQILPSNPSGKPARYSSAKIQELMSFLQELHGTASKGDINNFTSFLEFVLENCDREEDILLLSPEHAAPIDGLEYIRQNLQKSKLDQESCANCLEAQNRGGSIIRPIVIGGKQYNTSSNLVTIVNPIVMEGGQINCTRADNGDGDDGIESHEGSTEPTAEGCLTQWNGFSIFINSKRADDNKT